MNNIRVKSNTAWEFGIGPGCIFIKTYSIHKLIPVSEFTTRQP